MIFLVSLKLYTLKKKQKIVFLILCDILTPIAKPPHLMNLVFPSYTWLQHYNLNSRIGDGIQLWTKNLDINRSPNDLRFIFVFPNYKARLHGWHNAYQMTKAMVVHEIRDEISVLIIRPSVIKVAIQRCLMN